MQLTRARSKQIIMKALYIYISAIVPGLPGTVHQLNYNIMRALPLLVGHVLEPSRVQPLSCAAAPSNPQSLNPAGTGVCVRLESHFAWFLCFCVSLGHES